MGAILYPPKGMDYNEWLCELMCGGVEEDDRTETDTSEVKRTDKQ